MPGRKIKIYRFIEKLAIFLLVVFAISATVVANERGLNLNELIAAALTTLFLVGLIYLVQKMVDSWLDISTTQENYAEEDVFNALYDRSPVGYLTLNENGRITKANQAVHYILKGFENQIEGEKLVKFIDDDPEINRDVLLEKITAGVTVKEQEIPLLNGGEEVVWVLISAVPYRNTGERLVSLVDITEQKKVDTAKSEFVALATHQLRTPIAAIRWNTELLERSLREVQTDAQVRYLTKVNRNIHRMISLINDFLSVSKLEMGTYAAETVELNLSEFITNIIDEYDGKFSEKNINLKREDNPPDTIVHADRRLLHITLSNLVSNATKYTNANGTISISYTLRENKVHFKIADDGIGIPESELDSLFNKFFRASNAESHQTEGTGLGLYIVRESVEQMGGEISVSSAENEGTEFTVVLPVTSGTH